MEPTKEMIDEIDRDKVRQACTMTPGQKMLCGPELFDLAHTFMIAGLRIDHPKADEQEIRQLARQRMETIRNQEGNRFLFDNYVQSLQDAGTRDGN